MYILGSTHCTDFESRREIYFRNKPFIFEYTSPKQTNNYV